MARSFLAEPDPETNFKLFGPVAVGSCRRRNHQPRLRAAAAAEPGFRRRAGGVSAASAGSPRAELHGGVGSTIGARFAEGGTVEPFATELAVGSGVIASGAGGALEAELDIALVDYTGGLAEGRLMRGDNPVLMTMELVLEVLG